jgi:hypothetical protein
MSKQLAAVVGVILVMVGAALLVVGSGVVHVSAISGQIRWLGWGAWAIAFGAGALVWSRRTTPQA